MKPLHRFYENRQEANGESMIPAVEHQPTDDLRTRIAAAIGRNDCKDYHGTTDGSTCVFCVDWFLPKADAVIRELGLEPQCHYDPDCDYYRYVTDWIDPQTNQRVDLP